MTHPHPARPSLLSRYKTVYRDTIHQPGHAGARCRPCRGLPWSCRGLYYGPAYRIVAHHERPCAPLLRGQASLLAMPITIQHSVYIRSILDHFAKKFLEHLRLYFLGLSVQHLSYAIHQAYNFIEFIQHMIIHHSCYTHQSHIKHHA